MTALENVLIIFAIYGVIYFVARTYFKKINREIEQEKKIEEEKREIRLASIQEELIRKAQEKKRLDAEKAEKKRIRRLEMEKEGKECRKAEFFFFYYKDMVDFSFKSKSRLIMPVDYYSEEDLAQQFSKARNKVREEMAYGKHIIKASIERLKSDAKDDEDYSKIRKHSSNSSPPYEKRKNLNSSSDDLPF